MKKLTLILTLLFSTVMFSSTSFADWTKVNEDVKRNTYNVDYERIKKVDENVYSWDLTDLWSIFDNQFFLLLFFLLHT